jgi:hypothetical protein
MSDKGAAEMVYDIALWVALVLLGVGVIHRMGAWFLRDVGLGDRSQPVAKRYVAGLNGIVGTIFSVRVLGVLKVLIVDVLFQGRILRDGKDPLAWIMHICIFWGFVFLLFFHALGSIFATMIGPGYVSTLNPFLFLRNLSGLVLMVGLVLAVARRVARRATLRTSAADKSVIAILAVIALTGFLLEGLKITSNGEFNRMVTNYTGGALAEADTAALRAYWVDQYGLVVPQPVASHTPAMLEQGKTLHGGYCQSCHAAPQSAFVSYAVSRGMAPMAVSVDQAGGVKGLWWVHVLACCLGLAWIAFSKMFHVVSTPVSLIVAEVSGNALTPAAVAMRQMIELDGCSHGGACHDACPVKLRRLDRIGGEEPYAPMLTYLGHKSASDLGSRPVSSSG